MMLIGGLPMMTFAKEGKIKYNNVIYKGNVENGKVIFGPNNDVIQFSDKDHATFYEVNLERKE